MRRVRALIVLWLACAVGTGVANGSSTPAPDPGAARPDVVEPAPAPEPEAAEAPQRVVSLNPSLTSILLALGAGSRLVGVDEFSRRQQEAVAGLPSVGGLYHPSLESVVALEPDLVVLVPSVEQRDFRARLEELGIPVLALDPLTLDEVLDSVETLGVRVGRAEVARERVAAVRSVRDDLVRRTADGPRPRTLVVLQRDPLFVVGRGSFIDDMLHVVGVRNVAASLDEPYPRVSLEWVIAAAPEAIIDVSGADEPAGHYWARWASLPAVARGRVIQLPPGLMTLPGPYLDRALGTLARELRGIELEAPKAALR